MSEYFNPLLINEQVRGTGMHVSLSMNSKFNIAFSSWIGMYSMWFPSKAILLQERCWEPTGQWSLSPSIASIWKIPHPYSQPASHSQIKIRTSEPSTKHQANRQSRPPGTAPISPDSAGNYT